MNHAILDRDGTVMQFVGDAVMACFGAPVPHDHHAEHALDAALAMLERRRELDADWATRGLAPFGLGIGLSTGPVAAALLGSEERLEYTLVGDTVNLAQRLQDLARPAGCVVLAESTLTALDADPGPRRPRRATREGSPDPGARVPNRRKRTNRTRRGHEHDRRR